MFCRECGNQVSENAEICPSCGVHPLNSKNFCQSCGEETKTNQELCVKCGNRLLTKGIHKGNQSNTVDQPSIPANLAACCFPIVGIILYFVWKDEKPKSAKSVCLWALIPSAIWAVLYLFFMFIGFMAY